MLNLAEWRALLHMTPLLLAFSCLYENMPEFFIHLYLGPVAQTLFSSMNAHWQMPLVACLWLRGEWPWWPRYTVTSHLILQENILTLMLKWRRWKTVTHETGQHYNIYLLQLIFKWKDIFTGVSVHFCLSCWHWNTLFLINIDFLVTQGREK